MVDKRLPLECRDSTIASLQSVMEVFGEACEILILRGPIKDIPDDIDIISWASDVLALSLCCRRGDDRWFSSDSCPTFNGFGREKFNIGIGEGGSPSWLISPPVTLERALPLDRTPFQYLSSLHFSSISSHPLATKLVSVRQLFIFALELLHYMFSVSGQIARVCPTHLTRVPI